MGRIILVSNRLPVGISTNTDGTLVASRSSGGLATALKTLFDEDMAERRILDEAGGRAVVMRGKRVIDVRAPGADKGKMASYWHNKRSWEFVLCVGDDVTDESMFAALPPSAWTVKVGAGATEARQRFDQQAEVIELLRRLAA